MNSLRNQVRPQLANALAWLCAVALSANASASLSDWLATRCFVVRRSAHCCWVASGRKQVTQAEDAAREKSDALREMQQQMAAKDKEASAFFLLPCFCRAAVRSFLFPFGAARELI